MKRYSTPLAGDPSVPDWWESLLNASSRNSVFLSAAWLQTWLEVYGHKFEGQWIHWEDGNTVVGGCLLVTRIVYKRFVPLRALYLNATGEALERTPLAEFNDILHLPGYEVAIAADFAQFVNELPWSRLLLFGYEEGGVLDRLAAVFPADLVEKEARPAAYVDVAGLSNEPFERSLSGNTRNQIGRSRRLYEARSGKINIAFASDLDEATSFLEELARLHAFRWQSKGETGSFASLPYMDFHCRLISRLWSTQAIDLIRVSAGDSVIGYLYNFRINGKVYFFQSGLAYETDPKLKPGLVTHSQAIEHYRTTGMREYDFLAGDAQYKRSLAKQHRTLYWTAIYRDRVWMRLLLWIRRFEAKFLPRIGSVFS